MSETLPSAKFTMEVDSEFAPVTVRFSGPPDPKITYYSWNFGDGNTSAEKDPVHTYRMAGEYGISLTVGGPSGSSSFGRTLSVRHRAAPVARFETSPNAGQAPLATCSSSTIQAARLPLIAGLLVTEKPAPSESQRIPISTLATLTSSLSPTDLAASRDTRVRLSLPKRRRSLQRLFKSLAPVEDPPAPVASIKAEPQSGAAPLEVRFTNTSTDADVAANWDFDSDGQIRQFGARSDDSIRPAWSTYIVRLHATGKGGSDSASAEIIVYSTPPTAAFSVRETSGVAPFAVQLHK